MDDEKLRLLAALIDANLSYAVVNLTEAVRLLIEIRADAAAEREARQAEDARKQVS